MNKSRYQKCKDCGHVVGRLCHYCPKCGRDFVWNVPGLAMDGFEKGIPHPDNRFTQKHRP